MPRAVKVLHEKIRTAEGVVVEFKVWQVPKSENYPEGVKYSFFATHSGKILVGMTTIGRKGITGILAASKGRTISADSINSGKTSQKTWRWLYRTRGLYGVKNDSDKTEIG